MKKSICFWVLLVSSLLIACKEKNNHMNYRDRKVSVFDTNFRRFHFRDFIGLPADSLLSSIKEDYISDSPEEEPTSRLSGWSFKYPNNIIITIFMGDPKYIKNEISYERAWNIELFKKEIIENLQIKQKYDSIFGPIPSPTVEEVWDSQ